MNAHPEPQKQYSGSEAILGAIARWVTMYRVAQNACAELRRCDSAEVARIAYDLNINPTELCDIASKGPDGAALLGKMLVALGIDAGSGPLQDPLLNRDLQRVCVACDDKHRCVREFAAGTATEHYHEFCPNAYTLDALLSGKH